MNMVSGLARSSLCFACWIAVVEQKGMKDTERPWPEKSGVKAKLSAFGDSPGLPHLNTQPKKQSNAQLLASVNISGSVKTGKFHLLTGWPRFGSVTVWGWNGSSGSSFRFRRFLCKTGLERTVPASVPGKRFRQFWFCFRFREKRLRRFWFLVLVRFLSHPVIIQGCQNGAFQGKRSFCWGDTRHFRHFRRFPGSEGQNPLFLWADCNTELSPIFVKKNTCFRQGTKRPFSKRGVGNARAGRTSRTSLIESS